MTGRLPNSFLFTISNLRLKFRQTFEILPDRFGNDVGIFIA